MIYQKSDPFNLVDAIKPKTQEKILIERAQNRYYIEILNRFFAELFNNNSRPKKVLEVGCGTGHVLDKCCKEFRGISTNYYGCDLSNNLVATASKTFPQYKFVCSDGAHLPFADNTFDFVYAATVFVHASNPKNIVEEMKRVLVRGGKIGILDQDFETAVLYPGEKHLTREVLNAAADFWLDGWIGRRLPDILEKSGISDITISSFVRIDREFDASFFARIRDWIVSNGFQAQKAEKWYVDLCKNVQKNKFIFTRNFYSVSGVRE